MLKIKIYKLSSLIFLILFFFPFVSAEIIIEQPSFLLNKGDQLNISLTLIPYTSTNNYLITKISCNQGENEIFKAPQSLEAGEKKNIFITVKLDSFLVGNLDGTCYIKAVYGNEQASSQQFELTSNIDVHISVEGSIFNPGEIITLTGKAKKSNGKLLEGFVDLKISDLNISKTLSVKEGLFNGNISLPNKAPAGTYRFIAEAYEKDSSNEVINSGKDFYEIKIKQVIEKVDIALQTNSIAPKNEFLYTVLLFDQAGYTVNQEASIILYYPNETIAFKKLVKSGEINILYFDLDHPPGNWKIEAQSNDLVRKKEFYLEEVENASFSLLDNTLEVINIGNVPYSELVEIKIGEFNELKKIDVDIGKTKKYLLEAPDGAYEISVKEDGEDKNLGSLFLTGNVAGVFDQNLLRKKPFSILFFWTLLIVILIIFIIFIYKKVEKKTYLAKMPVFQKQTIGKSNANLIKSTLAFSSAQSKKEEASVVCLRIKSFNQLKLAGDSISILEDIEKKIKESKGKIDEYESSKIITFTSAKKEDDIRLKAARFAKELEYIIESYNLNNTNKINFGIGINLGEVITESSGGNIKYTSIGNTIITAKKLAELADNYILISSNLREKLGGKIKVERFGNFWKLKGVVNREDHSEFLERFKKREK